MAHRKKVPKKQVGVDRFALIEAALRKRTKLDLVELLMVIANEHDDACRSLELKLSIDKPVELLLADVLAAIDRATDFDKRMLNYNFDFDWQAYDEVQRGFEKLIELGELESVKPLALELMDKGSYQVSCSDEGLMSDDIEDCLKPVIQAVKAYDADGVKAWATAMVAADCIGCICDVELAKLIGKAKK